MLWGICMLLLSGCSVKVVDATKKVKDIDFVVVKEENVPPKLLEEIEKQKAHAFKMTFRDQNDLYVCEGYGKRDSGGYCIQVKEFYEAKNGIYVETLLEGTYEGEKTKAITSYPYIILKTEYRDLPVIFQ